MLMFKPEKMRYQMVLHGLNSTALSKKIGISLNTVTRTLRGETKPQPATLKAFADGIGCKVSDFYTDERTSMNFFERLDTMQDKKMLEKLFEGNSEILFKNYLADAFDNGASDEAVKGADLLYQAKGAVWLNNLVNTCIQLKEDRGLCIRLDETGEVHIYLPEKEFDRMKALVNG